MKIQLAVQEKSCKNPMACLVCGLISFAAGILYLPGAIVVILTTIALNSGEACIGAGGAVVLFLTAVFGSPLIAVAMLIVSLIIAFTGKKASGKNGKYIAGVVLALLGMIISVGLLGLLIIPFVASI